jgi:hypothetical protein
MRESIPLFGARQRAALALFAGSLLAATLPSAAQTVAQPPSASPPPAQSQWQSSPFHGVIGGDGKVIPCRCLFRGTAYRLGEKVCMNTPQGTVMTECDLQQNNTSWVPTSEACTTS